MKKLFKTFALIALTAATSLTASASDLENKKIATFEAVMYSIEDQDQVRLLLEKEEGTKLVVTLRNEDGALLYREFVGKKMTTYNKYFNLAELESGNYTFEIKNGRETIIKEITKSTQVTQQLSVK